MTVNSNIAQNTVTALSAETTLKDITFVVAYENEIKPTPLTKPIVAVSVKSCEIGDKLTNTLDNGEIVVSDSRKVATTVSVDIYLPYSMGGNEGHKIFDRIATFLIYKRGDSITKAVCYDADYDKNCQAIVVRTYFVYANTVSE